MIRFKNGTSPLWRRSNARLEGGKLLIIFPPYTNTPCPQQGNSLIKIWTTWEKNGVFRMLYEGMRVFIEVIIRTAMMRASSLGSSRLPTSHMLKCSFYFMPCLVFSFCNIQCRMLIKCFTFPDRRCKLFSINFYFNFPKQGTCDSQLPRKRHVATNLTTNEMKWNWF